MGENMQCQICGEPATVHLTQIVDSQIQKVDLCETCAESKGVTQPDGFSLADMLIQIESDQSQGEVDGTVGVCPSCGLSALDFKKSGRFGCSDCYDHFRGLIQPLLGNMHAGSEHRGKVPAGLVDRQMRERKLRDLEEKLSASIQSEDYEAAAGYRDEIRDLNEAETAVEEERA